MSQEAPEAHEGPIKTPKQLITAVILSFVVPIITIILLVNYVTSKDRTGAGSESQTEEAVGARIRPVAEVKVSDPNDVKAAKSGEDVFKAQCSSCHTTGMLGAPKFGDAGAWGPRLGQGLDGLLHSALKGKNQMPAQGGGDFSDLEIQRAVVYLANAGGGKFAEPAAPAGGASAPATTAAAEPAAPAAPAAASAQVAAATPAPAPAPGAKAEPAAAAAGAEPALYKQICFTCHAASVAGAPKVGDKAAWAPRIAQGIDGLTASAIKGKGAMPPKGGAMSASDADIKAVVAYMVNSSK